MSIGT